MTEKKDQKPGKILSERVFEAFGGFKIAQNYSIYRVLCTFPAENAGIYMVFCAFPAHTPDSLLPFVHPPPLSSIK